MTSVRRIANFTSAHPFAFIPETPLCLEQMSTWERFITFRFDAKEMIDITLQREFSYSRAQQWILDHEMFSIQIVIIYLTTVFMLKQTMKSRAAVNVDSFFRMWNLLIAVLSGICAAGMTTEFFSTLFGRGIDAALCASSHSFFHGSNGFYLWFYHIIRLFEFTDTLFIIFRKQPLLFIHWYHHALTLFVSWFTYARPSSFTRFGIYANALIHTVMYTYFFLRASKIRLPFVFAKAITSAQVLQFVLAFWSVAQPTLMKFVFGMQCHFDTPNLLWSWLMITSYLYLFIEFYLNKYGGKKTNPEIKQSKCE